MFDDSLPEPWILDYDDVLEARALLKTLGLPTELVLNILDCAQYWPMREFSEKKNNPVKVSATVSRSSVAGLCLNVDVFNDPIVHSLRAGGEEVKVKAIEFHIRSRDQGWTSESSQGTFNTSSWLEASILRSVDGHNTDLTSSHWLDGILDSPLSFQERVTPHGWHFVKRPEHAEQGPQGGEGDLAWYLQGNRVATQGRLGEYDVLWTRDGYRGNEGSGRGDGFLDELKKGDRLLIWARAKVRHSSCAELFNCTEKEADSLIVAWLAMHCREHQCCSLLRLLVKVEAMRGTMGTILLVNTQTLLSSRVLISSIIAFGGAVYILECSCLIKAKASRDGPVDTVLCCAAHKSIPAHLLHTYKAITTFE